MEILEMWDRQALIVSRVAERVTEETRGALPSADGWPLDKQLAHIHEVRLGWLRNISPEGASGLASSFEVPWVTPISDLAQLKTNLAESAQAIHDTVAEMLESGATQVGGYTHPVQFIGHMVWHEGWHVGLIMLGLRLAGHEPSEEWEEGQIWSVWRTEEWPG